MKRTV